MTTRKILWNHRPPDRDFGDYGLAFELIPSFHDERQRAALFKAFFSTRKGILHPRRALAAALIVSAEDALAACLAELGSARLQGDGYYCVARVFIRRKDAAQGAITLEVESGSHPPCLLDDDCPEETPRDQDLLDGVARVTDRPGSAAAIARALDEVILGRVASIEAGAEGLGWRVRLLGHASGSVHDAGNCLPNTVA